MRRGTTPTHCFTLPVAANQIEDIYITYLQSGIIKFEKSKSEIEIDDSPDGFTSTAKTTLSQAETLSLCDSVDSYIQIRFTTISGSAFASQIIREPVENKKKNGEI